MAIPSECKMPDLSGLKSLVGTLFIKLLMGERDLSQKTRLYRRNFVRLLDKALTEYHEARQYILAQIAEAKRPAGEMIKHGRNIYMLEFTNHIETCINAVSRLYKLLERIKSEKDSPAVPRELRRLVETKSKSIDYIRNAVEHMDELIQKDEIVPGKPIMLALSKNDDGVVVSNYEIKFEELAMVLKKMHEIAQYILTVKKIEAKPLI
jgi:hypothetical protein